MNLILTISGTPFTSWPVELPKRNNLWNDQRNFEYKEKYLADLVFLAKSETEEIRANNNWEMYFQMEAKYVKPEVEILKPLKLDIPPIKIKILKVEPDLEEKKVIRFPGNYSNEKSLYPQLNYRT